jgi:hypothetical protein
MEESPEVSPTGRRIRQASTLLTGLAVLGFVLAIALPRRDPPPLPRAPKPKGERTLTPDEEKAARAEIYQPVPTKPPPQDPPRLAGAMDDTVARSLVQNLKEAAVLGNDPLRSSLVRALGRTPGTSRPILESELAQAGNPAIRSALEEALRAASR